MRVHPDLTAGIKMQAAFRRLTDVEADRILNDPTVSKVIKEPVVWEQRATRSGRISEVRAKVPVQNSLRERLYLDCRITVELPWRSHWVLTWGSKAHHERPETIRRLDLRDDHPNPDREVWDQETHKHLWSEAHGGAWAYSPTDIPHDPRVPPVVPDDYRAIFEAFAGEVGVTVGDGYAWSDPLDGLGDEARATIWEAP